MRLQSTGNDRFICTGNLFKIYTFEQVFWRGYRAIFSSKYLLKRVNLLELQWLPLKVSFMLQNFSQRRKRNRNSRRISNTNSRLLLHPLPKKLASLGIMERRPIKWSLWTSQYDSVMMYLGYQGVPQFSPWYQKRPVCQTAMSDRWCSVPTHFGWL